MKSDAIIIKSINLWLLDKGDNKKDLVIPFFKIYALELQDVTTTVGHNSKGEFIEFLNCNFLNLRLYKDKLTREECEILRNYDILSITLNLSNNSSKSYNVNWDLVNNRNKLQIIEEEKDILKIFVG